MLSDRKLTKEAATLVRRVKTLATQHKKAIVSKEDVERGIAFLDELAKRTTDKKVKIDISTVSRFLKVSGGQDVEKVIPDAVVMIDGIRHVDYERATA